MAVRFLEIAEIEFDEAVQWYEAQAPGLGHSFLLEGLSAVRRISLYPTLGICSAKACAAAASTGFRLG